jgi:hypothetical protein
MILGLGFLLPLLLLGRFFWFLILALPVFALLRRLFIRRPLLTYAHPLSVILTRL